MKTIIMKPNFDNVEADVLVIGAIRMSQYMQRHHKAITRRRGTSALALGLTRARRRGGAHQLAARVRRVTASDPLPAAATSPSTPPITSRRIGSATRCGSPLAAGRGPPPTRRPRSAGRRPARPGAPDRVDGLHPAPALPPPPPAMTVSSAAGARQRDVADGALNGHTSGCGGSNDGPPCWLGR